MDPHPASDGRVLRGERTRTAVLDAAVALASTEGLEGMSLARLAGAAAVSKSGILAHWPDKESLQRAIVDHARRQWTDRVVTPALRAPAGVRRLWALHEYRLRFYSEGVLPGTCFWQATDSEFDDRPGPVRDDLAASVEGWLDLIRSLIRRAVEAGELPVQTDVARLTFEIEALGAAVVTASRLLRNERAYEHARGAVLDRLRSLSSVPELLPEN